MATAEVLLLVAATTFVAGIVAHAVWQARGWSPAPLPRRRRRDGDKQQQRAEEEGDEIIHLDSLDSSSSTVIRPHPRLRRPSHDTPETPPHPSPPPSPPLPTSCSAEARPADESAWIAKAGATDSWSEAVTGLEEEARDVW